MIPEIKRQWVEALRSGKFIQCVGQLKCGNCYCAVGVLADIAKDSIGAKWKEDDLHTTDGTGYRCILPFELRFEVELTYEHSEHIVHMNDIRRCNFQQIADYIEQEL